MTVLFCLAQRVVVLLLSNGFAACVAWDVLISFSKRGICSSRQYMTRDDERESLSTSVTPVTWIFTLVCPEKRNEVHICGYIRYSCKCNKCFVVLFKFIGLAFRHIVLNFAVFCFWAISWSAYLKTLFFPWITLFLVIILRWLILAFWPLGFCFW